PTRDQPLGTLLSADDLIGRPAAVFVLHGDRRPEEDAVRLRPRGRIDDLVRFELLLQAVDASVDLAQLLLAQLVFVVLAAVAVRGGHRDFVGDPWPVVVKKAAELFAQLVEARLRDVLLHGFLLPEPAGAGNFAA